MAGLLANACSEEPDALIALVRVCGGAPRVTGGSTRKKPRTLAPRREGWGYAVVRRQIHGLAVPWRHASKGGLERSAAQGSVRPSQL